MTPKDKKNIFITLIASFFLVATSVLFAPISYKQLVRADAPTSNTTTPVETEPEVHAKCPLAVFEENNAFLLIPSLLNTLDHLPLIVGSTRDYYDEIHRPPSIH